MSHPSNPGDRPALAAVCGLLLILAALVVSTWLWATADAQAVGGVGRVGRFMSPSSPADGGGGGVPADAIATEDDEGLLTEDDQFLVTES